MPSLTTKNQEETFDAGRLFASKLKGGEVLALYGDLGAGKTSFSAGIINYFIAGRVLSPTFIIVRHYYPKKKIINQILHADLYRLNNHKEIEDLGLKEYFNKPQVLVIIEWAEKMKSHLPGKRINIYFGYKSSSDREILIK